MNTQALTPPGKTARVMQWLPVRLVVAVAVVFVPFVLSRIVLSHIADPLLDRLAGLLSAIIALAAYHLHARKIEKREPVELSRAGSDYQGAIGLLSGALLFSITIGVLYAVGSYQVTAIGAWTVMLPALLLAISVAILEEVLIRGIVFRMAAQSFGNWIALLGSSAIFGLIHLTNEHASLLGALNAMEAGMLFAGLYLLTGKLWLPIGVHAGWNFVQSGVFSVAVSGHPSKGVLQGQLTGPEWLSGGIYGAEASVVALAVVGAVTAVVLWKARRVA